MFIGHYAIGLGAKKFAPGPSLGTYFIAAELPDLLWPLLCLAGVEHVKIDPGNTAFTPLAFTDYPISHSLLTNICWATAAALLYRLIRRDRYGAVMIWLVVLSHWVLDAATHRPDLPLFPGGTSLVGLGLWNSVAWTMVIETILFATGVLLYVLSTKPRDGVGSGGLWALVIILVLIYMLNAVGSPPPSPEIVSWMALGMWLFILLGYWIDNHRERRT